MPTIEERDGKWCVDDTCYDSEDEAKAAVEKLSKAAGRKARLYSQEVVTYVAVSPTVGQACAGCRWFNSYGEYYDGHPTCHLVESYPLPIEPTGLCNQYAEAEPYKPEPLEVVIVEAIEASETGMAEAKQQALSARIWAGIKAKLHLKPVIEPSDPLPITGGFKVYKDVAGTDRWIAWYSNNFEDRDSEFFSEKGIDAFVERVDRGKVSMPELWSWHEPGTRYGLADWVDRIGHYAIATGTYDETSVGKAGKAYDAKHADEYGVSHGFLYQTSGVRLVDGHRVYEDFNTFEISPLPKDKAANLLTAFAVDASKELEEKSMTPEKREHLVKKHGEEFVKGLEADTERLGKAHEALKGFKDFIQANTTDEAKQKQAALEAAEKAVDELTPDLLGTVADVAEAAVAAVKAAQTSDAKYADAMKQIVSLTAGIDALRTEMQLRPRSASQDSATVLDPESVAGKALLEQVSSGLVEIDPLFKVPVRKPV